MLKAFYFQVHRFLTRGIRSELLGIYRAAFALGIAYILFDLTMSNWEAPGFVIPNRAWLADWHVIRWLANRPDLVGLLERFTFVALMFFGVGLWTRWAYGAVVLNLTVWTLVRLQHTSTHPWAALFVAILGLSIVRWSDGFSLDRQIQRWRGLILKTNSPKCTYGFAMWLPGLVLGTAMCGASIAKLHTSGLAWITNGSVKYHFVLDSPQAPVDWGLWVASQHWVAVGLSAGAILTEGLFIVAVFLRPGPLRTLIGIGGFALLMGFFLFQNEVWFAWWLLWACCFTPWKRLDQYFFQKRFSSAKMRPVESDGISLTLESKMPLAYMLIVLTVIGFQASASLFQFEQEPLFSDYPMYSNTYESTADFDARADFDASFRYLIQNTAGDQDISQLVDDVDLDEPIRDALLDILQGQPIGLMRDRIDWISETFYERTNMTLGTVTLMRDDLAFDWTSGRISEKRPLTLITVDTDGHRVLYPTLPSELEH